MLEQSAGSTPTAAGDASVLELKNNQNACSMLALDRLPIPYPMLIVVVGLLAAAEQWLEHVTAPPRLQYPPGEALRLGAVTVIVLVYILAYLGLLKRRAVTDLTRLRPAVKIGDQEYLQYARRMLNANRRVEIILLLASVVVIYLMFVQADVEPQLRKSGGMPDSFLLSLIFASVYLLLGWLLLSLVYTSIRFARGLSGLARQPLEINVFDAGNLLPFGELSLIHSAAAAGLFLIPLVLLGAPEQAGFILLGLSFLSLTALFVPLLGVHRQMDSAKERALDQIHVQLMSAHDQIMGCATSARGEELADLANRTALLTNLRDLILKSPSWPFRDIVSLMRAVLAISSPFIIYLLQRMLDLYVVPLLGP